MVNLIKYDIFSSYYKHINDKLLSKYNLDNIILVLMKRRIINEKYE